MTARYDIMVARESNGKTYWTKLGVMFPMNGKDGFSISLEALPIPQMGKDGKIECRLMAFPPKEQDGYQSQGNAKSQGGYGGGRAPKPGMQDLDDEIPFAPCL
jgi:hypothetical protein